MILSGSSFRYSVTTLLAFAVARTAVHGFVPHARVCVRYLLNHPRPLHSKLFGPDGDFDDSIGNIGDDSTGGDKLVNDFFQEMRKREETPLSTETSSRADKEDEIIFRIQNPTVESPAIKAPRMDSGEDVKLAPTKKFTGQENFYAQRSSVPSTGGVRGRTPREIMMEQEYELVGRAERGIAAQAFIAVVALVFYIYIGMSGGIVSGPDAQMQDFGGDDEIPFEQLMPVQRDREISVWL